MMPDTLICALAQALHRSGSPAHELESLLEQLGDHLGVEVQSFCLPTAIHLTIAHPEMNGQQRVYMLRLSASDYNMTRLMGLKKLIAHVHAQTQPDLADAQQQLNAIMAAPVAWGFRGFMLGSVLLSGSASVLFGGSWIELLCSSIVGAAFVACYFLLVRWRSVVPILPFVLCALASLLAYGLTALLPHQKTFITVLSGIILIAPGFTITVALAELATMNLIAGAARLAGSGLLLMMMAFGVAFGTHISQAWWAIAPLGTIDPLPVWAVWPAVAVLGISIMTVVQAPMRTSWLGAAAALLAYGMVTLLDAPLGAVGACFASAFGLTVCANVYQRMSGQPSMLLLIPGLMTLVPGSVGFRGLHALLERNSLVGINTMTDMAVTATALAIGSLMGNAIAPTIAKLRLDDTLKVLSLR